MLKHRIITRDNNNNNNEKGKHKHLHETLGFAFCLCYKKAEELKLQWMQRGIWVHAHAQ